MLSQDRTEFPTEICVGPGSVAARGLSQAARHVHLVTVSKSFERSPNDLTYLVSRIPDLSFVSNRSHLFRNKTSSTFARSLLLHTDFQRRTLSSCYEGKR